jgi:transposase-like protein
MCCTYARREREIDRVILAGFVLGLSTRKVGEALLSILGQKVSASTVSRVAKTLDAAVAAFHRRPLNNRYKVLMLDGVVLARRTGAGVFRQFCGVSIDDLPQSDFARGPRDILLRSKADGRRHK